MSFLFRLDLLVPKRFTRGYGYLFYIDSEYSAVQCHHPVYFDGSQEKINVYDSFVEGAKEGFTTAVRIIPYLVAFLVGIAVFRTSGAMDFLVGGIGYIVGLCGVDTSFVGALPTALMKSLSGSGANGLMIDTMKELGPDSFVGRMSCVVRGASDTTFYILAVYFGSVGITKTRNAVTCGLIADFSGIIAAILISYLFFF